MVTTGVDETTLPGALLSARLNWLLQAEPDTPAVQSDGTWVDWRWIARIASEADRLLADAGLGKGAAVGLVLRNNAGCLAAMLALIASGRCLVTLNPFQPAAKLARDIEALRLPAVIADAQDWSSEPLEASARRIGALAIAVDPQGGVTGRPGLERSVGDDHAPATPDTAVLMLTSGTTGEPKRVPLSTAKLERSLLGAGARSGQAEEMARPALKPGVVLVVTPMVHIGGMWTVLFTLISGRRVALMPKFNVDGFLGMLDEHRPKSVGLAPAALRMLYDAEVAPERLACLKSIIAGTAPLDPDFQARFESRYGIPILITYGATEFAGAVAGWSLEDHRAFAAAKRGSVGRPSPGFELRVIDAEGGAEVAPGETGLLEVRAGGERGQWVRTTDLAVIDADGFLYIRGRADDVIIRGGFKVAPKDVAAVLAQHGAVAEAAVVGMPDPRLGAVPVAAVELLDGQAAPDEAELIAFARERLVAYQVPVRVFVVESLPRTPSMKVSQPILRELIGRLSG